MISVKFIPIFEDKEFTDAVNEYQQIWKVEGSRIVDAFKKLTGMSFIEDRIAVIVYEGISFSGRTPTDVMKLRASYSADVKKATIVHELSHRLLFNLKNKPDLDEHQVINLFLYDVWVDLYGENFATEMVEIEKKRDEKYQKAWGWALNLSKEQRVDKFAELFK